MRKKGNARKEKEKMLGYKSETVKVSHAAAKEKEEKYIKYKCGMKMW